ncbi:MAG TPA: phosphoglycerate mutase family protein [Saprospiraceae bacterium]|nr:phosphoglycerate mutase family protein [Saprospiraceae bacterium]HPI05370.1 phosphoglycerate mutase family protein [Saprospiraceae bacterium]
MKKTFLLAFPLLALMSSLFSCEKDPEIMTQTVVETDTVYVTQHDTIILHATDTLTLTDFIQDTATTFIVLRHAETSGSGSDPNLSAAGMARADELRRILGNVPLAAVFSSNYNRTRQTAQPTATDKSLNVNIYDPLNQSPLVDEWLSAYRGQTVLVLGHSNTVPALLNLFLGSNEYSNLPDTEYNNLFIATVSERGRAKVLHLKYGD